MAAAAAAAAAGGGGAAALAMMSGAIESGVVSGITSVSGMLARMVIQEFFYAPSGTEKDPIFEATKEVNQVLDLYREALRECGAFGDILPNIALDKEKARPESTIWERKYFRINGLRVDPSSLRLRGAVRDSIDIIHVKLTSYHEARPKHIYNNAQHWYTKEPIKDHKLFVLLIISKVLNTIGSYRQEVKPEDAIRLLLMLEKFTASLIRARLAEGKEDDKRVGLSTLVSRAKTGIGKEIKKLKDIFEVEKQRHLYLDATNKAEQSLTQLVIHTQNYVLQWLQGNEVDRVDSRSLLSTAQLNIKDYHLFADLLSRDSEMVTPGTIMSPIIEFCRGGSKSKEESENLYYILRVLTMPIELSELSEGAEEKDKEIGARIIKAIITMAMLKSKEKLGEEMSEEEFYDDLAARVKKIIGSIPEPTRMLEVTKNLKGMLFGKKTIFTGDEVTNISDNLIAFMTCAHTYKIVRGLAADLHEFGEMVGSMAGAFLPKLTKLFTDLLAKVAAMSNFIIGIIEVHTEHGRYVSVLPELRAAHATIGVEIEETAGELRTAISCLATAASNEYLEESRDKIIGKIKEISEKFILVMPEQRKIIVEEASNAISIIQKITTEDVGTVTLERSLVAGTAVPIMAAAAAAMSTPTRPIAVPARSRYSSALSDAVSVASGGARGGSAPGGVSSFSIRYGNRQGALRVKLSGESDTTPPAAGGAGARASDADADLVGLPSRSVSGEDHSRGSESFSGMSCSVISVVGSAVGTVINKEITSDSAAVQYVLKDIITGAVEVYRGQLKAKQKRTTIVKKELSDQEVENKIGAKPDLDHLNVVGRFSPFVRWDDKNKKYIFDDKERSIDKLQRALAKTLYFCYKTSNKFLKPERKALKALREQIITKIVDLNDVSKAQIRSFFNGDFFSKFTDAMKAASGLIKIIQASRAYKEQVASIEENEAGTAASVGGGPAAALPPHPVREITSPLVVTLPMPPVVNPAAGVGSLPLDVKVRRASGESMAPASVILGSRIPASPPPRGEDLSRDISALSGLGDDGISVTGTVRATSFNGAASKRLCGLIYDYVLGKRPHESDVCNEAEALLRQGASPNSEMIIASSERVRLLHVVAGVGALGIIKVLRKYGADPFCSDHLQRTPLHVALYALRNTKFGGEYLQELVKNLIDDRKSVVNHKASNWWDGPTRPLSIFGNHIGWTPLHVAVYYFKNPLLVRLLCDNGADLTIRTGNEAGGFCTNKNAIELARRAGHPEEEEVMVYLKDKSAAISAPASATTYRDAVTLPVGPVVAGAFEAVTTPAPS